MEEGTMKELGLWPIDEKETLFRTSGNFSRILREI